jgi:hypothetical protein
MKGIEFEAAGVRHCVRYDFNTLCQLEDDFGLSIAEIGGRLQPADGTPPRMGDIRLAFRAGLGADVTLEEAGSLISEIGLARAGELVGEGLALSFGAGSGEKPSRGAARGKPKAAA